MSPSPQGKAYLRHIAMLGASPPVVKGLEQYSLSEYGYINTVRSKPIMLNESSNNILDDKAETWLKVLLASGDQGYKSEIDSIKPTPSADNNYLVDPDTKQIKGQFLGTDGMLFDFYIKQDSDGTYSRSFKPVQDTDTLLSELEISMNELMNEDLVTDEDIIGAQNNLNEALMPDDEEYLSEDDLYEDETSEEDKIDMAEYKRMCDENKKLKMMAEQFQLSETRAFVQGIYEKGQLLPTVAKQKEVVNFLSSLQRMSKKQPVMLGEGTQTSAFNFAKKLLSNLPKLVELSEIAPKETPKAKAKGSSPMGTYNDPDQEKLHNDVVRLCEQRGSDYKNPTDYKSALIEVVNNGQ
jgi:hypothetical protein